MPGATIYDMIFCRNLLTYFDRVTQDNTVSVLQRLLKAKGALFVGPSETGLILSHDFVSAKVPLAFAFRKINASTRVTVRPSAPPVRPAIRPPITPPPAVQKLSPQKHFQDISKSVAAPRQGTSQAPVVKHDEGVADASALADQGPLVEAAKSCDEHMRRQGPSPRPC